MTKHCSSYYESAERFSSVLSCDGKVNACQKVRSSLIFPGSDLIRAGNDRGITRVGKQIVKQLEKILGNETFSALQQKRGSEFSRVCSCTAPGFTRQFHDTLPAPSERSAQCGVSGQVTAEEMIGRRNKTRPDSGNQRAYITAFSCILFPKTVMQTIQIRKNRLTERILFCICRECGQIIFLRVYFDRTKNMSKANIQINRKKYSLQCIE